LLFSRHASDIATFFDPPIQSPHHGNKECNMLIFLKWFFTALFAALAWLIGGYTVEYFRPYKKK
jgi:hypothetical protein